MPGLNAQRVDDIVQYALACAAREGGYESLLGPIHLLKYVYLGDLAHAETGDGSTYTGAPWQFYHYGPWCLEVFERIGPALAAIGAEEETFRLKFERDALRWRMTEGADDVFARLDRALPHAISRAVKHAVHEYGSDTTELLHFVYGTAPMLSAAPNDMLRFARREVPARHRAESPAERLTRRQEKKREAAIQAVRERVRASLRAEQARMVPPDPPPRYDEVYERGTRALDDAQSGLPCTSVEAAFSDAVWTSFARRRGPLPR